MGEPRGELRMRAISLGAGRQSSCMYLMAVEGEIRPKPDVAIFADTQCEPPWVYEHLWRLAEIGGDTIPIHVVTKGDMVYDMHNPMALRRLAIPPLFVRNEQGKRGILNRQCTSNYKIEPILRGLRALLGVAKGHRVKGYVETWVGISWDEVGRMKPPRDRWEVKRYPLIEHRMRVGDCEKWLASHGYPVPKKSACWLCPYHSDSYWRDLRDNHPAEWGKAIEFDRFARRGLRGVKSEAFLHSSLVPLDQAPIDRGTEQAELFGEECAGVCGV